MSDTTIIITRPLDLQIDIINVENDAFRAEITFHKTELHGTLGGQVKVYFGKREWLMFVSSLRMFYTNQQSGPAILSDYSTEFTLRVERQNERFLFSLKYRTRSSGIFSRKTIFRFTEITDDEVFGAFRSAFEGFPLWQGETIGD